MTQKQIHFSLLIILTISISACATSQSGGDPLKQMEEIKQQIVPPEFPAKDFYITDFGAVEGGEVMNTKAIEQAIQACFDNGGGRVIVPNGTFLTGAIHLKSNVNLHLEDNATLLFSSNPDDYLPVVFTRWEGMELMNYSSLIYAYEQENIAVTGKGLLDGQATNEHWWYWCNSPRFGWEEGLPNQNNDRNLLHDLNRKQVPPEERIFGDGHYLRPNFIQFYKCKNIHISDVRIENSPMWVIHPVLCENVTIERVHVESLGPNSDGCNPESSKNVLIRDSYFNTGDDCIAIKSGRDQDGRRINVPSENIIVENCDMRRGHGGVVLGSEVSGGVRNVFAVNCRMDSPLLRRALRIKTSSSRGGVLENLYFKDISVGSFHEAALRINMYYEGPGDYLPVVRNIHIENMTVEEGGQYGILIQAYPESPVENLTMVNCRFDNVEQPVRIDNVFNLRLDNVYINNELVETDKIVFEPSRE